MNNLKLREQIEAKMENYEFDSEYAEYIMEHAPGDRVICNGDTLTIAMEDGYLYNEFIDHMVSQAEQA